MEGAGFLVIPFDSVRAELAVAAGEDETAITYALHGLSLYPPPLNAEALLPLAVRALANLAQASRDRGADPAPELARLRELRTQYPEIVTEPGANAKFLPPWRRAMQALADAETARCRQDPDEASSWQAAADACRDAEVSWDEAYCRLREAQSAIRDRKTRAQGAAALRRAYAIATDLDARPLLAELDLLARNAHVPTVTVADPPPAETIPGLTTREREILAHVVAGRTYREIAAALVLSEKTVSTHISNMLRKTGTGSRIELAQLASRHTSELRTRVSGPRT
jgi:DNA-binding CsgD family transcriptional regulator